MRLLVFITKQVNSVDLILSEFLRRGISGATVIDCMGMLKSLNESSVDPPPIFGSLRRFIAPDNENTKLVMVVLSEEMLETARDAIHKYSKDLSEPNSGVLFEVPLMNVEGVPTQKP